MALKQVCDVDDLTTSFLPNFDVVLRIRLHPKRGKQLCFQKIASASCPPKIAVALKQAYDVYDLTTPLLPNVDVVLRIK